MATWLEKSRSPEYSPAIISRELSKINYLVGIDEFDEAMAGETIVVGGYLNTILLKAKSILAKHLDVNSLSAISADIGEVTSGILRSADNTTWINLNDGSFSFEDGAFTSGGIDMSTPSSTYLVIRARYQDLQSALSAIQLQLTDSQHNAEAILQAEGLWLKVNNTYRLRLVWDSSNNRAYFTMEDSNFSNTLDSQGLAYWSGSQRLSHYDKDACVVEGPLWADELYVSGEKSRVVKTRNYGEVLQYAIESPTPIFVDIGHGIIGGDGLCYVDIEEIFSETIDLEPDYHIQLTKYGEGDVWVKDRQNNHFVIEGTPNLKFAWEIKAKQKGYSNERLDKHNRFKEDEETDYASLADKYLMEYEKELIA